MLGSLCFMAPELFEENKSYDAKKVDIWALGIIFD